MSPKRYQTHLPSRMEKADFVQVFGGVYEHSPWIADLLFGQGLAPLHDSVTGLAAALSEVVEQAGRDAQLRLLRAHPDLAGRLAVRGELTAQSTAEQAGAGLDQCSKEEFQKLQTLNDAYQARFGFPFILAVKGKGRAEITATFERRVGNQPDDEFAEALDQVHRIAYLRLLDID